MNKKKKSSRSRENQAKTEVRPRPQLDPPVNQSNSAESMKIFETGAKRSTKMPRYDLIPKVAQDRLAKRFTGEYDYHGDPDGGALKYGEGNWERGLPTSDVFNHIMHHITNWQENFRRLLTIGIHHGYDEKTLMDFIRVNMVHHSDRDDDLAGAMWGICVLMEQERTTMYHDNGFKLSQEKK